MPDEKKTNLDETRERLEIDNLDEGSRKQLFNKFVEKGGTVINPTSQKMAAGTGNNTKTMPLNRSGRASSDSSSRSSTYSNTSGRTSSQIQSRGTSNSNNSRSSFAKDRAMDRKKLPFFKRIAIWFKAYSIGVINFDGKAINESFLLFIYKNVSPALIEIDSLIYSILYPIDDNKEIADEKHGVVLRTFKDLNDYELLERVRKFNNKEAYSNIMKNSSMNIDTADANLEDFKSVFKPLFVLRLYTSKLNHAISSAYIAHSNVEKISKELVDARVSTFSKIIDMVYSKYYNKLLLLISYIAQKELTTNVELNEFLQISDEDILGYYALQLRKEIKKKAIENRNNAEERNGNSVEERKANLRDNKIISIGMTIVDNFVSFEKDDDEKNPFYNISINDKIYRLKVLFDFLEREYGYVLISNKVKYAVIYEKQKKTDYQKTFSDSFSSLAELPMKLNEYANMYNDMMAIENDDKINFAQRSMIVSEKRSRVSYISRSILNSFTAIITPIKESLDKLLLDKEERKRIIENQDNILQIDQSYLKKKPRIQGYTVIKGITEAYYFVAALNHIVTTTDLSNITSVERGNDSKIKEDGKIREGDRFADDLEKAKESIENIDKEDTYDTDIEDTTENNLVIKDSNKENSIEDINTEINIDDILDDEKEEK